MNVMSTRPQQLRNIHTGKPGNKGQFDGFTPAADEGITLTSFEVIDDDVDVFYDSPVEYEPTPDVVTFEMGEENLVRDTYRIVGQVVARMGLPFTNVDDIAGEVLSGLYATAASYRNEGTPRTITGGLIRDIARKKTANTVDSHKRHEDSKGFRMWKALVSERQAELGRTLDARESNALAEEIRTNWPDQAHRPAQDFHKLPVIVSIDNDGDDAGRVQQIAAADPIIRGGGQRAHKLADLVEEKNLTKVQARRQLWNVFAAEESAPEALPGYLSPTAIRHTKNTVKDALHTATQWQAGNTTDTEAASLFAPFGPLTDLEKKAVTNTILARPAYGHRMWLAAVDFAANTDGYIV